MIDPYSLLFTDFTNPIYRFLEQSYPLAEYLSLLSEAGSTGENDEQDVGHVDAHALFYLIHDSVFRPGFGR